MVPHRVSLSLAALAFFVLAAPVLSGQQDARSILPDAPSAQATSFPLLASLQSSSSSSQQPGTPEQHDNEAAEKQLEGELHQRMAGVIPNFNVVLYGQRPIPLSAGQKLHAAFRSAVDPYQFGLAIVVSGYGQATDSHDTIVNGVRVGYGQGWAGFGKRYGANYTDQFTGTMIGNGLLPIILHQDARYYQMGPGSFTRRFFYALSTTVVAHSNSGKLQPNYSNVLGNLISGGISNAYYPKAERGFGLTIEQGMVVTAEGSFGALLEEFYPDIRKHLFKKSAASANTP